METIVETLEKLGIIKTIIEKIDELITTQK